MKSALVIGSCGGIGSAICSLLLENGWIVYGADIRDVHPGHLTSEGNYCSLFIDILDANSVNQCALTIARKSDTLEALIYAAGTYDHFPLAEAETGRFENLISVNVTGAAAMVSAFFPYLNKDSGRIIVISSETALASLPFQAYGVSKQMLEVYIDSLRQEMKFLEIPVIAIRPGAHSTYLLDKSREALGNIPDSSSFSSQLKIVRDRGQEIIDKGAADPREVGRTVMTALQDEHPNAVYSVNVSWRFRLMHLLPSRLRARIIRWVLRS